MNERILRSINNFLKREILGPQKTALLRMLVGFEDSKNFKKVNYLLPCSNETRIKALKEMQELKRKCYKIENQYIQIDIVKGCPPAKPFQAKLRNEPEFFFNKTLGGNNCE